MRTPPLLADFSHARACKPFCENSLTLPKSDETMIEYSAGNIMHYLMNNNEIYSVTWVNENAEVLIQGNLSIADLEKMVDSIY